MVATFLQRQHFSVLPCISGIFLRLVHIPEDLHGLLTRKSNTTHDMQGSCEAVQLGSSVIVTFLNVP